MGKTRLRIVLEDSFSASKQPCFWGFNGEAEDYTIDIQSTLQAGDVSAITAATSTTASLLVSPSPAHSMPVTFTYTLIQGGDIHFKIVDLAGRVVKDIRAGYTDKGLHNMVVNEALKNGTYMILLMQQDAVLARSRLILQR